MRYSIFNCDEHDSFYQMHTHRNLYEMFLCIKGNAIHLINNKEQLISTGSITFIRPDDIHGFIDPISEEFQVFNMSVDKDVMEEAFEYLGRENANTVLLKPVVTPNRIVPKLEYPILRDKLERMFFLHGLETSRIHLTLRLMIINVLSNYFLTPSSINNENMPPWIQRVVDEMHRPEYYVVGVRMLYEIACKCPEHVCREFKKYLNKTPTEIVNEIRLEEAAKELVYTKKKVIDISGQVGFENLSHFHHWFKKIYGLSPLEFRYKSTVMDIGDAPTSRLQWYEESKDGLILA
ncbi:MAG: AraC family transcriptional regulator [Treponema sp.]|nr:AraC family transcriptional regulator [Treponema sp.]